MPISGNYQKRNPGPSEKAQTLLFFFKGTGQLLCPEMPLMENLVILTKSYNDIDDLSDLATVTNTLAKFPQITKLMQINYETHISRQNDRFEDFGKCNDPGKTSSN